MASPSDGSVPELVPGLEPYEVAGEAARCLYCHEAPCSRACPAGIDVASFIRKIVTGNMRGSARLMLEANVLAAGCGRVCPAEELCEASCVLPDMGRPPVQIRLLQRHVMDWAMAQSFAPVAPGPATGKRVAVVGGGPAGIACAAELRRLGHAVTVLEADPRPGGLMTHAIADYKVTPAFAVQEVEWLARSGFELRTGVAVGQQISFAELEAQHDAVFLGLGLALPSQLAIPGEALPQVVDALPLIRAHREGRPLPAGLAGRHVVVVGGGNTATDVAILALTLGAESSTIVYRRSETEMPAYPAEVELARDLEVGLTFLLAPVRILGEDRVTGIVCQPMRLGDPDDSGRRRPEPSGEPEVTIACDVVVRALGQRVDEQLLAGTGVELSWGRIVVDPASGQTSNPRYFAGGDCVNGGREVVHAAAEGMRAARGIHTLLCGGKEA